MSCMMMQPDALYALADAVSAIHNLGFDYFGFWCPESLHNSLKPCIGRQGETTAFAVYRALYRVNARAYAGRYRETVGDEAPRVRRGESIYRPAQYVKFGDQWALAISPWHYRLVKLIRCWLYQTAEDATLNDPLRAGMNGLLAALRDVMISNSADYINASWGSI